MRSRISYDLGYYGAGAERTRFFKQAYDDAERSVALDPTDADHQKHLAFIRENLPAFAPPARPY
ncbi:MAG TPA: hypothetical protein VJ840_00885 [Gemmatimonadaceae bacterium]|nr:hypothetical protein [Gemmatimonadaceae bacterium]